MLQPARALPARCTVAVVGAGLAGLTAALELARADIDVVVVEAAPGLGTGQGGRGLGHVELGVLEHPHRTMASLGAERAAQLFGWTDQGKAWLDGEGLLDRCGCVWAATDPREPTDIARSADALATLGRAAEVWPPERVDAELGATGLGPGLWLPDEGRLRPAALTTLAARAHDAGAKLVGDCPAVFHDDPAADGVVLHARGSRLEADTVIVCAGARSGSVDGSLAGRVIPVRELVVRCRGDGPRARPLARAGQGWTTWSRDPDGGLRLAGCRWASPHLEVGEADDTVVHPDVLARLTGFAARHLGVPVDRVAPDTPYLFAQTPDGLPLVGPLPGDPRRIVCTGFGASSAAMAVAAATTVVQGLLRDPPDLPWMLSPRRMVRWRAG